MLQQGAHKSSIINTIMSLNKSMNKIQNVDELYKLGYQELIDMKEDLFIKYYGNAY